MARSITDKGYVNLMKGLIAQGRRDILRNKPDTTRRRQAEAFFRSRWFERMTGLDGKKVLAQFQSEYDQKHPQKGASDHEGH